MIATTFQRYLGSRRATLLIISLAAITSFWVLDLNPLRLFSGNLTLTGDFLLSAFRPALEYQKPVEGAEPVMSFSFAGVDVRDAVSEPYRLDTPLLAGEYQILGFMDIDENADPNDRMPDTGDPVMIPIGDYLVECVEQPFAVEFAILLP